MSTSSQIELSHTYENPVHGRIDLRQAFGRFGAGPRSSLQAIGERREGFGAAAIAGRHGVGAAGPQMLNAVFTIGSRRVYGR